MTAKNATITKEQAKEELIKLIEQLGRVPTRDEFIKLNTLKGCHKQGISILFGKPLQIIVRIFWCKIKSTIAVHGRLFHSLTTSANNKSFKNFLSCCISKLLRSFIFTTFKTRY